MFSKLFIGVIVLIAGDFLQQSYAFKFTVSDLYEDQAEALQEFRSMVKKEVPHNCQYMKQDVYLLRFLVAEDFNLVKATELLKQNLMWRHHEKIDTILEEDWSNYESRFPYEFTVNKEGGLVLYYNYGRYNISPEVDVFGNSHSIDYERFNGGFNRLDRYLSAKMMEDADRKSNKTEQFDIIINLDGYDMDNHGCIVCWGHFNDEIFFNDLLKKYDTHYPGAVDNIFIVNMPPAYEKIYHSIAGNWTTEPFMSTKIIASWDIYEKVLLKHINREDFPATL